LRFEAATDQLEGYDDHVFFVSLAPIRDSRLVASRIAKSLSVETVGGQPPEDALIAHLRGKKVLLVLDNFEHILDAATLVSSLLAASAALKVLATSRETLHISGEHDFQVNPLELPLASEDIPSLAKRDSVVLFCARAKAAMPEFLLTEDNARTVVEICRRLDGLPLAIELAAARVKVLGIEALLQRLDNRMLILVNGPVDKPKRQQTLQDAIAWSYGLLDRDEQALFSRLGVFVGGGAIEAVERIFRDDLNINVSETMESLLKKSMLSIEQGQTGSALFSMLETLRDYARQQLERNGEIQATRRSHANYYLSLAEQSDRALRGTNQPRWLDLLDSALDNLRAVLDWAKACEDSQLCLRMTAALGQYWFKRNYYKEGVDRTATAIELAQDAPPDTLGRVLISGSWLTYYLGARFQEGRTWA
jgi:predicted ATPase